MFVKQIIDCLFSINMQYRKLSARRNKISSRNNPTGYIVSLIQIFISGLALFRYRLLLYVLS